MNERHWRAIRDRVRQWVLAMYATWQALKPAWFTDTVKTQIPDAFIPTEALRRENSRARHTVARLRSLSFALGAESDADRTSVVGVRSLQPIGDDADDSFAQPNEPAARSSRASGFS